MRQGFSLIESLAALALTAILLTGTVHIGTGWSERQLLSQHFSAWVRALHFARAHALAAGTPTIVCPSSDSLTCAAHGRYEDGWLIFVDGEGGTPGTADRHDRLLAAAAALPPPLTLRTNFTGPLRFSAAGRMSGNGRFVLCLNNDHDRAAGVVLIRSGRLRRAADGEISRCQPD